GSKHTCRQKSCFFIDFFIPLAEDVIIHRISDCHRNRKGKETKDQTFISVGLKLIHIEFQTGYKHDIEQTDGREYFDFDRVQNIEIFIYDNDTCYNQSNNSLNRDFL